MKIIISAEMEHILVNVFLKAEVIEGNPQVM